MLVYVFVLCVYGFLWGESDKFYMFECVVDNFVDNLWINPDTKTYQKINCLTFNKLSTRERQKEKEKTPGKVFRGFGGLCAAFVVAVAVVVTLRELLRG